MFAVAFMALAAGYPVAITLAGVALLFAAVGTFTGAFNPADLGFTAGRLFGIVTNQTLIAVPLFVFMGVVLEKTRIAEGLLDSMSRLLSRFRGGLAITVVLVGMLMAASTGIVGATVIAIAHHAGGTGVNTELVFYGNRVNVIAFTDRSIPIQQELGHDKK